ncbi:hypothetical protein Pst134EA_007410 [Puccinia striiformis f. sp. tritici]|uniref:hypothetical protein n=2 Tax=Puccinia striiformis f. sp. tritici TaxID=168172 RepID=UPI002007BB56|nr:hypothetical protein Pst134EA_007410 [Puccinia striiformis f. sp. tritici]KAH9470144.1 hypothetical protein Pst134EA_007410 [Puccinia striiformis f. sp. tritici]
MEDTTQERTQALENKEPADRRQQQQQSRRRKKLNNNNNNTDNQANNNIHDDQPPTSILLPPDINLPITIQYLFVPQQNQTNTHQLQNHNSVSKTTPLFSYYDGQINRSIRKDCISVNHNQIINDLESAPDIKTYESPIKGELIKWSIIEGQVLHEHDGWRTRPIVSIKEPCTHAVQWHGQCAICGSDLTIGDYTGISETSRASIPMSHGPSTLTVSVNEAERLENETRNRLLKAEKLSLIVDLDQTIVHATVDPTVGEWMVDPSNPNWKALQNVSKFQLNDGPSSTATNQEGGGGCYYYLKQRPGLTEFLNSLSEKYEMHVYTMGTRAYAEAVCKIIDPTNQIFGNRILSRDESGSMTQKSITRLFPVDTSMVVIIDDRGDVWEYSPNLVAVVPYNFFVGIGDINGAFLPPTQPLEPAPIEAELPPSSSSSATVVVPITDPQVAEVLIPMMTVTDDNGSTSSLPKVEEPKSSSTDNPSSSNDLPISSSPSASSNQEEMMVIAKACETSAVPISSCSSIIHSTSLPSETVPVPLTSPTSTSTSTPTITTEPISNEEEEIVQSNRSKLLAEQVLNRPLKQKQIALELEVAHQQQHKSKKSRKNRRKAGGEGRSCSSSSVSSSSHLSEKTDCDITPTSLDPSSSRTPAGEEVLNSANDSPTNLTGTNSSLDHLDSSKTVASSSTTLIDSGPSLDNKEDNHESSDSDTNTDLSLADDDEDDDGDNEDNDDVDGSGQRYHNQFRGQAVLVDHDKELNRLEFILGDIHSGFYSQDLIEKADAREVISAIKHDVLHGIHVAFSSLWPMEADSEQQYAWKLAEQFGACCYTQLTPRVTHLVAAKLGTSKVNTALNRPNVAIVRPKWLYDAALLWTRPLEEAYSWRPVAGSSGMKKGTGSSEEETETEGMMGGEEEQSEMNEDWGVGMAASDWKDATAEVMAALDETDDDDESGIGDNSSESDEPGRGRKRARTSSAFNSPHWSRSRDHLSSPHSSNNPTQRNSLEHQDTDSPLSKRKCLARSRSSKLKLIVPINDEETDQTQDQQLKSQSSTDLIPLTTSTSSQLDSSTTSSASSSSVHSTISLPVVDETLDNQLSPEDDEFLSALAAEMEGDMAN